MVLARSSWFAIASTSAFSPRTRDPFEKRQTSCGEGCVAAGRFLGDGLRHEQLEAMAPTPPDLVVS